MVQVCGTTSQKGKFRQCVYLVNSFYFGSKLQALIDD